jgi:hypothetical protein
MKKMNNKDYAYWNGRFFNRIFIILKRQVDLNQVLLQS